MKASITSAAALAALFSAHDTLAVGFGDPVLSSDLASPLRVSIPVLGLSPLQAEEFRVEVPGHRDQAAMGLLDPVMPRDLDVKLVPDGRGGMVVRMTTPVAVREPVLRFLLRARWRGGSSVREYEFIVDPPSPVGLPAPVPVSRVVLATPTPPAAARGAVRPVTATPGTVYGPISPGDTLYAIASAAYAGRTADLGQAMEAIVSRNPDAFVQGDASRLLTGASLVLPPAGELAAGTDQAPAVRGPAAGSYVVARGDTLFGIARRMPGVSPSQVASVVARLYAQNPQAFIDGDRDRLRLGAELRLDSGTGALAAAPATEQAAASPAPPREMAAASTTSPEPAASTAMPAASPASETTATTSVAPPVDPPAPGLNALLDDLAAAKASLAAEQASELAMLARIDILEQEMEALRQRDAALSARAAELTEALARRLEAAAVTPDSQAPTIERSSPQPAQAPSVRAAVTRNEPVPEAGLASVLGGLAMQPAALAAAGVLALVLLGGGLLVRRRRAAAARTLRFGADEDAVRRRLAEVRERMDGAGLQQVDDRVSSSGIEVENVHLTDPAHASNLAKEAVAHLAYGDYDSAKSCIEGAIALDPHRDEHKMVLLSVYQSTGQHARARELVDELLTRREQLPRELRQQVDQFRQVGSD